MIHWWTRKFCSAAPKANFYAKFAKYRFYNDSPNLSNLRLIKCKIIYQRFDIVIKWNNGGISITIMCVPLFQQCVFSYLNICFCAKSMVKGCWMRHFQSLLFRFVLMDAIPIKLKCRYIVKSRYMGISYTLSKLGDLFMSSNGSITRLLWDFVQSNLIWPTFGHKMDLQKQLSLKSCNHLGQNL